MGVDTDLFKPASDEASRQVGARLRQQLGFGQSDIVCIYTGRFTEDKGSVSLAQAVGNLATQGEPFRGLFVGSGPQATIAAIQAYPGCVTHSFVPVRELPQFYWAADIGVWPKQESTSQLDAACCGLPIIVSNRVQVRERIEGNGLTYEEDDVLDLARKIKTLADADLRQRMGYLGRKRMLDQFSWNYIARQRVRDYEAALQS